MPDSTIRGPVIMLAQGYGKPGWKTLEECARSAAENGFVGMQVHLWLDQVFDLEHAAVSPAYCDQVQDRATKAGCPIVELANHVEWQLVRCSPAFLPLFEGFAPKQLHGNPVAIAEWAATRAKYSAAAARNFGFKTVGGFSGTSIFHVAYPWPQRPSGLVQAAFHALADAWKPIFDFGQALGVDYCFELHPGEDLMDTGSFNRFLKYVCGHSSCNILLDLSHRALGGSTQQNHMDSIRKNKDRIKMLHVKDGEFVPTADGDVYGSYAPWSERPSKFCSLGDGQIVYRPIFDLLGRELQLLLYATLEWEDCKGKGWKQGVREGAKNISAWINQTEEPKRTPPEAHEDGAFDDFAATDVNTALLAKILGIPEDKVNTKEPA